MLVTNHIFTLKENVESGELSDIRLAVVGSWAGHQSGSFAIDMGDIEKMKLNFDKREIDTVVDYEHQTLTGSEAPAAGWIKELYIKDSELWGKVEWTERAKEYIKNGEYRYLSPVYEFSKVDEKTGAWQGCTLHSASLTNKPFLDELGEVVANKNIKETNLEKDTKKIEKQENELAALKSENDSLKKELGELKDSLATQKVEAAIAANKIGPSQKEWALAYCKNDSVGFDKFLESTRTSKNMPQNGMFPNKSGSDNIDIVAIATKK